MDIEGNCRKERTSNVRFYQYAVIVLGICIILGAGFTFWLWQQKSNCIWDKLNTHAYNIQVRKYQISTLLSQCYDIENNQ